MMISSRNLFALSFCALQMLFALATPARPNILERANEDIVNTPAGPVLRSKLHPIPQGAHIQQLDSAGSSSLIRVLAANGTTINTIKTSPNSFSGRALSSGYVAYFYWGNTAPSAIPIALFTTTWIVPPIPDSSHDSQLLYLFNGLQPTSGVSRILQPVLQYGVSAAGGGDYWSVASWYVSDGEPFFTPAVQVSPGQSLQGILTLTSVSTTDAGDKVYGYNSVFAGIPLSSLSISSPVELTFAWEVLEIYNASQASDLPRGTTKMTSINIVDNNGHRPPVSWVSISADSNFGVKVVVDGPTDGEVDIIYPLQ